MLSRFVSASLVRLGFQLKVPQLTQTHFTHSIHSREPASPLPPWDLRDKEN